MEDNVYEQSEPGDNGFVKTDMDDNVYVISEIKDNAYVKSELEDKVFIKNENEDNIYILFVEDCAEIEVSTTVDVDKSDPLYCADCKIQFVDEAAFATHFGSSNQHATVNVSTKPNRRMKSKEESGKPRGRPRRGACSEILNNGITTATQCEVCNTVLSNDVKARKHYETEHPDTDFLKRYMCDVCGHTTRQYANLLVHMRTHTNEKPYECPHCDRRFNMPSNRDRHLVVHTGEKRFQCQHCSRRFTQSSACKLHIQTVHLKIPYAPWNKKNRKKRKEHEVAIAAIASSSVVPQTQHKVTVDTQGDYLNAYISYSDDI